MKENNDMIKIMRCVKLYESNIEDIYTNNKILYNTKMLFTYFALNFDSSISLYSMCKFLHVRQYEINIFKKDISKETPFYSQNREYIDKINILINLSKKIFIHC